MQGYETKELRKAHMDALVTEKASAETRVAHATRELEEGASGPQKAYLERVVERSQVEIAAVDGQLKAFSAGAKTRRQRASQR